MIAKPAMQRFARHSRKFATTIRTTYFSGRESEIDSDYVFLKTSGAKMKDISDSMVAFSEFASDHLKKHIKITSHEIR